MEERQPLQVLIDYRKGQGMTSAELAQFLEESRPTVHRWETGARKIDEQKLPKIAEKTGISPRELRPDLAELLGAQ
jgi:transcriptional regulator with XRE-family HTH domain